MALDPSIPLGVKPLQLPNPLEIVSTLSQIQSAREQTEARRLAGEERRQKAMDEAAARQRAAAVEQHVQGALTLNPTTGRPTLDFSKLLGGEVPAATVLALSKATDEAAERLVELESANLDLSKKKTLMLGTLAQPVATAGFAKPAWDAALLAAFNKKLITAEERDAGYAITDPAAIQKATTDALTQAGLTPKPSELQKITTVDAQGREVTQFVEPTAGATYLTAPQAADVITVQTIDEQGRPVTKIVPKTAGGIYPAQPPAPQATDLITVQTVDEQGRPVTKIVPKVAGATYPNQPGGGRPATEGERKAAGFHGQMQQALTNINRLEAQLTDRDLYQIQSLPQEGITGAINRGAMSENAKRYIQAFNQFTEARLRPVSGAAIAASEYERDRATYGKQYAETKDLATQRQAARAQALDALRTMAGSALEDTPPPSGRSGGGGGGAHKVGDIVTVKGQKVRVTKLLPNGKYEGVPVP